MATTATIDLPPLPPRHAGEARYPRLASLRRSQVVDTAFGRHDEVGGQDLNHSDNWYNTQAHRLYESQAPINTQSFVLSNIFRVQAARQARRAHHATPLKQRARPLGLGPKTPLMSVRPISCR